MTLSTYSPKAANPRARVLAIVLFALSLCLFVGSFLLSAYSGILQLVALLLIVSALFIASRFLFVSYTYSLFRNEKGTTFFLIEEKQGKRASLVCRMPLSRVLTVKPFAGAAEARDRHYTYVATMHGGEYQLLLARGEGGKASIKIEADDAFLAALRDAIAEARTTPEDEE